MGNHILANKMDIVNVERERERERGGRERVEERYDRDRERGRERKIERERERARERDRESEREREIERESAREMVRASERAAILFLWAMQQHCGKQNGRKRITDHLRCTTTNETRGMFDLTCSGTHHVHRITHESLKTYFQCGP